MSDEKMRNALNDDDLAAVSGGFKEDWGFAKGLEIYCPNCGKKSETDFKIFADNKNKQNVYRCNNCDCEIRVGADGKAVWAAPVKKK